MLNITTSKIPSYHEIFKYLGISDVETFKNINKGRLGLWKIENLSILSCICLKPKVYSIKNFISEYEKHLRNTSEEHRKKILLEEHRCKGVPYACMKNVTHSTYNDALQDDHVKHVSSKSIRSYQHKLFTIESSKVGFHGLDMKRKFIGNKSEPFGYNPIDES